MHTPIFVIASLLGLIPSITWGAVINLSPGDLSAPTNSYWVISGSYTNAEYNGIYSAGVSDNTKILEHREYTLGLTRFYKSLFGMPAFISASLPSHSLNQSKDGISANGIGDLGVGIGIWPHLNRETKESFGVGISMTHPTGEYDSSKTLNSGENRIRYNALLRYRSPMVDSYWSEITLQKNWVGDNSNFGGSTISTDPAFAISAFIAKRGKNFSSYFIGLEKNYAGKTYLNNATINSGQEDYRVHLGWRQAISSSTELVLRTSKTLKIDRGYNQSEWFQLALNRRF